MRGLLVLVAVALALWCGYWFVGSSLIEREAEAAFQRLSAKGMRAGKTALYVKGFPNRFDLTVEGLDLADPARKIGWQAPRLQIFAMTWKPWHIIAAFPGTQEFALPDQRLTLTGTNEMASLRALPSTDLPLAEARLVGNALHLTSDAGWTVGAASLALALRADPARAGGYEFGLEATSLAPDPALTAALAAMRLPDLPPPDLPVLIDRLRADLALTLTAGLDRHLGETRPQLSGLRINDLQLVWGPLRVTASGEVSADAQGLAAGRIEAQITGWDRLPAILVASGAVRAEIAPTVAGMLKAGAAGGEILKLPLVLRDGQMSLGPLPLGPAPRLVLAPPG
ncbi:MAG: DUF2125 domain-containing protein [Rhodobacteraceae bacterium]|jgi:hypothetical protein|nr:DUF2125 domain-containing protein [Paracoccaceae bacterium]